MTWEIEYLPIAKRFLKKLDSTSVIKILSYLRKISLADNPDRFGKPLSSNLKGFWRYRVGDYRLICDIKKKKLLIIVVEIGHRSKVYKGKS